LFIIPKGLFESTLCNNRRCNKTIPIIAKGNKKCKLKNLFNVALFTEKPPHNHSTKVNPIKGITENKLVITVAPQKLI
jgi:hypothetical protein